MSRTVVQSDTGVRNSSAERHHVFCKLMQINALRHFSEVCAATNSGGICVPACNGLIRPLFHDVQLSEHFLAEAKMLGFRVLQAVRARSAATDGCLVLRFDSGSRTDRASVFSRLAGCFR